MGMQSGSGQRGTVLYMHKVRKEGKNGISTGTDAAVRTKNKMLILSQKEKEPYEFKRRYARIRAENSPGNVMGGNSIITYQLADWIALYCICFA